VPQRLQAIELEVSEFEAPTQLSFAEFNRLGMLTGLDAGRRQALAAQEQLLAARHGDASFRHVASVDPDNVLTERRVRWQIGANLRRGRT
jgi:hypothetical protein